MSETNSKQPAAIAKFRDLHETGCFLLPNPWDAGSAVYLESLGFKALATTSSGYAFTRGLPDKASAINRDDMLAHFRDLAAATRLPVNADFQNGYADLPENVAENVSLCVSTGVAGLSIEDSTENGDSLYEFELAVERIKAARKAIDDSGIPVVLTARCEVYLVGQSDPLKVALKRLVAFAQAGADCLYAPGVSNPAEVTEIVKAVAPKPVNLLVSRPIPGLSFDRVREIGVRRISVGSGLNRVAWGAFMRASQSLIETGSFEDFSHSAAFADLDGLFANRKMN